MAYSYESQRKRLFSDEGQRLFMAWRDEAKRLLSEAGAFRMSHNMLPPGVGAADSFDTLACADRMIELGELRELTGPDTWGQDRVFVERDQGR